MSELSKLVGTAETKNAGTFVLQGQEVAKDDGFKNVSKIWFNKTQTYEQALETIEAGRAATRDITATVAEMSPTVDSNGRFAFWHIPTGKTYIPTPHAIKQAGNWADTGTWYVESMLSNPTDAKERQLYARDRQDAETLAQVFRNGFRRLDQSKKFFWRTRQDGSLRAMLTDRYAVVDNRWFIERLREFVPGGRVSHSRGDSDTIFSNILIPDTIREDKDSDYGGMLSIGNSEIGERRVSSQPSIFRAICMNGCIWGATAGKGIKQVHRGKIDLAGLAKEIQANLQLQIPLLPAGIDKLLSTRSFPVNPTVEMKTVFAALAKDEKLSKKQTSSVLNSWRLEHLVAPELSRTLFGVTNAITRAGQSYGPSDWVKFDEMGGRLLAYTKEDFNRLLTRANSMNVKDVEEMYANAV